jgi:propanediol utilization protein
VPKSENEGKKVPLTAETDGKLEKMAKAEGITPSERTSRIIKEETGHKEREENKLAFPVEGQVNAYKFIHLSNGVATTFGIKRGEITPILIDFQDGKLIISKK